MKIFPEEQQVLDALLEEWYKDIRLLTERVDSLFSERGKMYDRTGPAWENVNFPHGFVHELSKRIRRVEQHLAYYPNDVNWDALMDELKDILNFDRMFGAVVLMMKDRGLLEKEVKSATARTKQPRTHGGR